MERLTLADRTMRYASPCWIVFNALTDERAPREQRAPARRCASSGTTVSPPDDRGIGIVRYRLNYLFGSALRGWTDGGGLWS
ncbi:MAG TPA: hypothetical protein VF230_13980 [Acidimicrobiales bacterium]